MPPVRRLGILTGGGDAPGLNAVIRAVVKSTCRRGIECVGIQDGFEGLLEPDRSRVLQPRDVTGILRLGGTILGTVNRGADPRRLVATSDGPKEYGVRVAEMAGRLGLDALVVVGGDGTLAIAYHLCTLGVPIVGVPKTIDNDIVGTESSFGFNSAVEYATDAIDRLHATAEAHHRILVVEVMGRYAGWIALYAGLAGGADAILIPEIPFDPHIVAERLLARERRGARFSVVVVAEGACPKGGSPAVTDPGGRGRLERLGGMGAEVCRLLAAETGKETRSVVLGHLQRGGQPTSTDRVLATRFGSYAVELAVRGRFGTMVAYDPPAIVARPLGEIVGKVRLVPVDSDLIQAAKAIGVTFGD